MKKSTKKYNNKSKNRKSKAITKAGKTIYRCAKQRMGKLLWIIDEYTKCEKLIIKKHLNLDELSTVGNALEKERKKLKILMKIV